MRKVVDQMLSTIQSCGWPSVIGLVLMTVLLIGCQSSSGGSNIDGFDCEYDPVGIGSWGPGESLADFDRADVVIKGEVTGHRIRTDEHSLEDDGRSFTDRLLFNEVRVSKADRKSVV